MSRNRRYEPPLPLPIPLKPFHLETHESYWQRLSRRNFLGTSVLGREQARLRSANRKLTILSAERAVVERMGGLREGHFEIMAALGPGHRDGTSCSHCRLGVEEKVACRRCTFGERVVQYPHFRNICIRHRRWVGPGTDLQDQVPVGDAAIKAETKFKRLVAAGKLDAVLHMELRDMFFSNITEPTAADEARIYPDLVRVAKLITSVDFAAVFFDPRKTFRESRRLLAEEIKSVLGDNTEVLIERLWVHFRPVFLTIRESVETGRQSESAWAHEFMIPKQASGQWVAPVMPLEPFERYFESAPPKASTLDSDDSWQAQFRWLIHYNNVPGTRAGLKLGSSSEGQFICLRGHRSTNKAIVLVDALRKGRAGCAYCANHRVWTGYNDLETTHPRIAAEWHPELNGDLLPNQLIGGSSRNCWWICAKAHEYEQSLNDRTGGQSCPFCANKRVWPQYNDLATLHPDLAAEFDVDLNEGLAPDQIHPGTPRKYWWRCRLGHSFEQSPIKRTGRGYRCPFCSHRRFLPGFNDIKTRFPELVLDWDRRKNSGLDPSKLMAKATKYWWKCKAAGHGHFECVGNRRLTGGCPACAPERRVAPGELSRLERVF